MMLLSWFPLSHWTTYVQQNVTVKMSKIRMSFYNYCANLKIYKQSHKGVLQDFIIRFDEEHRYISSAK